jgi:hypothetical protein
MGVACLAEVHFRQPIVKGMVDQTVLDECKFKMVSSSYSSFSSISHTACNELLSRGQILLQESFIDSAAYYFGAGFKFGKGPIQRDCLFGLLQSLFLLENIDRWIKFALRAFDWAYRHYPTLDRQISFERARWLIAYRDYCRALEELAHVKEQSKGALRPEEIVLLRTAEKAMLANAYARNAPCRFKIGRTLVGNVSFGGQRSKGRDTLVKTKPRILWLFGSHALPPSIANHPNAVAIGRFKGGCPTAISVPWACATVHDFRGSSWFIRQRSTWILHSSYSSEDYLHFIVTDDRLIVFPLETQVNAVNAEDSDDDLDEEEFGVTWADVMKTIVHLSRDGTGMATHSNLIHTGIDLSDYIFGGVDCRRLVLDQIRLCLDANGGESSSSSNILISCDNLEELGKARPFAPRRSVDHDTFNRSGADKSFFTEKILFVAIAAFVVAFALLLSPRN